MEIMKGDKAPDFEVLNERGESVRLSDFRKGNVLLVFYAADFSDTCSDEMACLRDDLEKFTDRDTQVVAISCDGKHSHRAFKDMYGIDFPLLSDFWPHGEVARRYGVFDDVKGQAMRGTFLIDKDGIVLDSLTHESEGRTEDEFLGMLKSLTAKAA